MDIFQCRTHFFNCLAFQPECFYEIIRDITRYATPANQRIVFMRLKTFASFQSLVFIWLEIRESYNNRLWVYFRSNFRNSFCQLIYIHILLMVFYQEQRMLPYIRWNYEFNPHQANSVKLQVFIIGDFFRLSKIHIYFCFGFYFFTEFFFYFFFRFFYRNWTIIDFSWCRVNCY